MADNKKKTEELKETVALTIRELLQGKPDAIAGQPTTDLERRRARALAAIQAKQRKVFSEANAVLDETAEDRAGRVREEVSQSVPVVPEDLMSLPVPAIPSDTTSTTKEEDALMSKDIPATQSSPSVEQSMVIKKQADEKYLSNIELLRQRRDLSPQQKIAAVAKAKHLRQVGYDIAEGKDMSVMSKEVAADLEAMPAVSEEDIAAGLKDVGVEAVAEPEQERYPAEKQVVYDGGPSREWTDAARAIPLTGGTSEDVAKDAGKVHAKKTGYSIDHTVLPRESVINSVNAWNKTALDPIREDYENKIRSLKERNPEASISEKEEMQRDLLEIKNEKMQEAGSQYVSWGLKEIASDKNRWSPEYKKTARDKLVERVKRSIGGPDTLAPEQEAAPEAAPVDTTPQWVLNLLSGSGSASSGGVSMGFKQRGSFPSARRKVEGLLSDETMAQKKALSDKLTGLQVKETETTVKGLEEQNRLASEEAAIKRIQAGIGTEDDIAAFPNIYDQREKYEENKRYVRDEMSNLKQARDAYKAEIEKEAGQAKVSTRVRLGAALIAFSGNVAAGQAVLGRALQEKKDKIARDIENKKGMFSMQERYLNQAKVTLEDERVKELFINSLALEAQASELKEVGTSMAKTKGAWAISKLQTQNELARQAAEEKLILEASKRAESMAVTAKRIAPKAGSTFDQKVWNAYKKYWIPNTQPVRGMIVTEKLQKAVNEELNNYNSLQRELQQIHDMHKSKSFGTWVSDWDSAMAAKKAGVSVLLGVKFKLGALSKEDKDIVLDSLGNESWTNEKSMKIISDMMNNNNDDILDRSRRRGYDVLPIVKGRSSGSGRKAILGGQAAPRGKSGKLRRD